MKNTSQNTVLNLLGIVGTIGFMVTIPLIGFSLLGRTADNALRTSPLFFLIGVVVAIVFSTILIYRRTVHLMNSVAAEKIFSFFGFPVTNSMLVAWIVMGILAILSFLSTRRMSMIPSGLQNFFESIFESIIKIIDSVTGDRKQSFQFFPLIATIFIFVLLGNWLGLLPGVGSVGIWEEHEGGKALVPFLRSTAADLNFTLALAVISVTTAQVVGIASIGFFRYSSRFINFSSPLNFFIGVLELISEAAKLISFSFRLFGNIFAGEVLLTVMFFLVPYFVPLPFMLFEVFVGFIQAMVFAMLTLVFLKIATVEMHH